MRENMDEKILLEEEAKLQPKPLSQNAFAAFWQRIWRWWQGVWYGFSEKHVKLSAWIYKIAFFFIFSMSVTVLQYIGFVALPYAFGLELAGTEFVWPHVKLTTIDGNDIYWNILGYNVSRNAAGEVIIGGGLGYFLAYEITVFIAQCINFPLQRNITFRSHGNPWWQAMWYFIGWVLVSLFCNAINGLWIPFAELYLPAAVYNLLVTFVTGGVSMVIFFFIFLIIFPDVDKTERSRAAKLKAAKEKLDAAEKSGNAEEMQKAQAAYEKAALAYDVALENKKVFHSEKAISSARSLAEAKINGYHGMKNKLAKYQTELKDGNADAQKKAELEKNIEETKAAIEKVRGEALEAVASRDEIVPVEQAVIDEVKAARAKRAAA